MITYNIYMMTPSDHMSHDLSYFSGPSTSGAVNEAISNSVTVRDFVTDNVTNNVADNQLSEHTNVIRSVARSGE